MGESQIFTKELLFLNLLTPFFKEVNQINISWFILTISSKYCKKQDSF